MRILAIFTGAFSVGIFLAQYLIPEDFILPCAVCAFILACGRFFVAGNWGRRLLLAGTGLAFALAWNIFYININIRPLENLSGTGLDTRMMLLDYASPAPYGARVPVKIENTPGRVMYYGNFDILNLNPGDMIEDHVRLRYAGKLHDEDENIITNFTSSGIFLIAYGTWKNINIINGDVKSPRWYPVRAGRIMREKINALLTGNLALYPDQDSAAFLCAILTGDRSELSVQASANLSESGFSHILAVSGLHCGFLIALIILLFGVRRRFLIASMGILSLIFYALLTGGKPSVIRASIMLSILIAAPLFRRASDAPTSLCLALFLILFYNPFAAASVSLQLSFASVAGLLWLTPKLYACWTCPKENNKNNQGQKSQVGQAAELSAIRRVIAAGVSASLGALVFTTPLLAKYYQAVSLVSILANLFCLWSVGVIFAAGLAAVFTGFILPPVGAVMIVIPEILIKYILFVTGILSKIPYHAVYLTNPYIKYWICFIYILFASAWLFDKIENKNINIKNIKNNKNIKLNRIYKLAAILAVFSLLICIRRGENILRDGDMNIIILDVGQGQSVILESKGRYVLTDCGSGNNWYDAGTIAAGMLGGMGCRRLDAVILTHYDADHVNGLASLLARLNIDMLIIPEELDINQARQAEILNLAQSHGVRIRIISQERENFIFGAGNLIIFPPFSNDSANDRGLSVMAAVGDTELLITGDMDAATERKLIEKYNFPDLEAIIAGHHGSKYSTCEEFLDKLKPEIACISVGSNSYGHPAPEVLERLKLYNCVIYRTDLDGNIRLKLN